MEKENKNNSKKPVKASSFKIKMKSLGKKIAARFKKLEDMTPIEYDAARKRRKESQRDFNSLTVIFALSAVVWFVMPIVKMHIGLSIFGYEVYGVTEPISVLTPFDENTIFSAIKSFSENSDLDLSSLLGDSAASGIFGSIANSLTQPIKNAIVNVQALLPNLIACGVVYGISVILRLVSGIIFAVNKKRVPCLVMQSVSFGLFTLAGAYLLHLINLIIGYMPGTVDLQLTPYYGIILQYVTAGLALICIIVRMFLKDIPAKREKQ